MERLSSAFSFRVMVCGIPELAQFSNSGMTHVLSIMDPATPDPEAFAGFPPHDRTVLRFHDDIREEPGRQPPQTHHVRALLELGDRLAATPAPGAHVLVHCHMGISRSTAAVVILLAQQNPGAEREAFAELRRLRPFSWPNSRMIAMADDLLGRGGALIEALHPHRHEVLKRHPEIADLVVRIGREHELPAGYARGSLGPFD
jgi:predicted protein tyrosine phosphatase